MLVKFLQIYMRPMMLNFERKFVMFTTKIYSGAKILYELIELFTCFFFQDSHRYYTASAKIFQ